MLVTEWPEFAELDLAEIAGGDARHPADRRAQLPRRRQGARRRPAYEGVGRPALKDREPARRRSAGADPRRGEGTRLRPLTTTYPKPVVPLVDRPFIGFMLDWLRSHGVEEVIMGCGHMADGVRAVLGDGSAFGVKLSFVEEPRPLGTGGALKSPRTCSTSAS